MTGYAIVHTYFKMYTFLMNSKARLFQVMLSIFVGYGGRIIFLHFSIWWAFLGGEQIVLYFQKLFFKFVFLIWI